MMEIQPLLKNDLQVIHPTDKKLNQIHIFLG